MKKIIALIITLTAAVASFAQQQPIFSQYMYNTLAFNPAYAGSRGALSAIALYRTQWVGMEGQPRTANLAVHSPFFEDRFALGLNVMTDQIGPYSTNSFTGSYAYKINMQRSVVSLGLQASLNRFAADLNSIQLSRANTFDAAFTNNDQNYWSPNFGIGGYWYSMKGYLGASIPSLIARSNDGVIDSPLEEVQHAYFHGGYVFDLAPDWKIKPSALLRASMGAPAQVDLNGTIIWNDILMLGLTVRNLDAVAPMVQVRLRDNLYFGYAMDFATTELRNSSRGTHEIFVGIDINTSSPVVISPRYF